MVPTRLLLEGLNLEALLARVRDEYGPDARIVSAERVKSGGIGGFFSKERYALTVELATDSSLDELDEKARHAASAQHEAHARHAAPAQHEAPGTAGEGPTSLDDLVAMADTADRVSSFAQALASARTDNPSEETAEETAVYTAEVPDTPSLTTFPPQPSPSIYPKEPQKPKEHQKPDEPAAVLLGPLANRLVGLGLPVWLATRAIGFDTYTAIAGTLSDLPAASQPPTGRGDILVVLGDLAGAVIVARSVLATWRLDPEVLAVAGPNTTATSGGCRLTGQADAGRWASRLRMGDTPGIVLVEADLDARTIAWAKSITAAIGPTVIWAVVDATRKIADCSRWLEALGRVDALAVHSTTGTSDPASVLSLGFPVAMVDGLPATPHTWAALLCQRLTESSHAHR